MADNQRRVPYDERDWAEMANNVFHQLCEREAGWQDITELAKDVKAYDNTTDVAYTAEVVLLEMKYIERDPYSINVRLTPLGRENCGRGISIPPSDIQKLRRLFEKTVIRDKVAIKVTRSRKRPKRLGGKKKNPSRQKKGRGLKKKS